MKRLSALQQRACSRANSHCAGFTEALSITSIKHLLEQLALPEAEALSSAHFDPARYQRLPIFHSAHLEVLLMGWLPGQASPLHDHGTSICGVRVLTGEAFELSYRLAPSGILIPTSISTLQTGEITVTGGEAIHQVGNGGELPLVSLHVYSPPLANVRWFASERSMLSIQPVELTPPFAAVNG